MKRLNIIMLLVTLISMGSIQTKAHDFEVNGMYYNIVSISEKTCEVTYRGADYSDARFTYSGTITVPEFVQYNGRTLKVIGIGDNAFNNYDWWNKRPKKEVITSISLPNSIEYLGKYSLAYNSFSDFRVPTSLKKIGYGAFEFYVSEGVKRIYVSDLKAWCEIDFEGSKSSPFAPYTEDSGYYADTIGIANHHIGDFYINNKLAEEITIPEGVKKINKYAFINIGSIKEIILPEGIENIEDFAFCNCTNLESIKIPSTCKEIKQHAFNGCKNLAKLYLSEGIERIGDRSFKDCTSLSSVTIPSTIQSIGGAVFEGSHLPLLTITYSETPLLFNDNIHGILYGSLIDVKKINFQREFVCNYRDFINTLYDNYKCSIRIFPFLGLKNVVIGPHVKVLHRQVFGNCNLDSVVFQDSNTPLYLGYEIVRQDYKNGHYQYQCKSPFYNMPIKYLYMGRPLEENQEEFNQIQAFNEASFSYGGIFEKSQSFEGIDIGNPVVDISLLDFSNYKELSNISFGMGVVSVPDFSANNKLDSIVVINDVPPAAIGFANTTYLHCKLFVPKGCKAAYESADVWQNFWNIIELDQDFNSLDIQSYNVSSELNVKARYAIGGTKIEFPQRGINIIKMNDGTLKKVYVK